MSNRPLPGHPVDLDDVEPERVVDRDQRSWMNTVDGYTADMHATYSTLAQIGEEQGPVREVLPITDADREALIGALGAAGRKAIYSLAVAVYRSWGALRDDHGGMDKARESFEVSERQLVAGRPGSWESARLKDVAMWVGTGKPSRIHEPAVTAMQTILYRWVTDPARYTEVAETLAAVVSEYADAHGGWPAVADQWLQPGALDTEGVFLTYSFFYSLSEHFDASVLG